MEYVHSCKQRFMSKEFLYQYQVLKIFLSAKRNMRKGKLYIFFLLYVV